MCAKGAARQSAPDSDLKNIFHPRCHTQKRSGTRRVFELLLLFHHDDDDAAAFIDDDAALLTLPALAQQQHIDKKIFFDDDDYYGDARGAAQCAAQKNDTDFHIDARRCRCCVVIDVTPYAVTPLY